MAATNRWGSVFNQGTRSPLMALESNAVNKRSHTVTTVRASSQPSFRPLPEALRADLIHLVAQMLVEDLRAEWSKPPGEVTEKCVRP